MTTPSEVLDEKAPRHVWYILSTGTGGGGLTPLLDS
jgi:hypothetical protein